jgi:hypothetical protein
MKKLILGVMSSGLIAILFLTGGCKLSNSNPSYTEFAIQVDSIQHQDTIAFGKMLNIKFYGTIGPSACYSFSRFSGGVYDKQIDIAVLGKYKNGQNACASVMQYLNGDSLDVNLITPGSYIIHVIEPTPPDIYDTLFVSQPVTPAR